MKILVFDTETSGLPERNSSITETHKWPYILQLSYILFCQDSNSVLTQKNVYVAIHPSVEITEASQSIHNISREICIKHGSHIRQILNEFNICLQKADRIVGHNISFDKRMIMVECIRNCIPQYFTYYSFGNKIQKPEFCTMKQSIELCKIPYKSQANLEESINNESINNESINSDKKIRYKYPTLHELYYTLFNLIPNNLHDSMVDILITFRCYIKIISNIDICVINNDIKDLFIEYKI